MLSESPLVTIYTITRNRADLLPRAMNSVLSQTYKNIEYILIDSASTDNTQEVVASFKDDRIRYIRLEENRTFGQCINLAASMATGKYFTELDDDDEYVLDKIEKQVVLFETLPMTYGMVYCWMTYFDGVTGKTIKIHKSELRGSVLVDNIEKPAVSGTPAMLIRTSVFKEVGGYKEVDEIGVESDWELACRVCEKYLVDYVPESLINVYVNHGHLRMSDKGYYKNQAASTIKFEQYFLNRFADAFKNNQKAGRTHYCALSHSLFIIKDYKEGFRSFFKLCRTSPSFKQLLYPFKGILGK